jgi:Holliday junction resolvase RusA-like endonuclease
VEAIQEKASYGLDLPIPKGTPIKVRIEAVYSRPTSQFRKKDPDHQIAHTKRPDIDNVCKSILDGLKNLWVDDSQVCCIEAIKKVGAIVDRKTKTSELARVDVSVWTGDSLEEL